MRKIDYENQEEGSAKSTYRNIEGAPIIEKIKELELGLATHTDQEKDYTKSEKAVLKALLEEFGKLLKVKYGGVGYLVESTSEDIVHLYGVDTDEEFYSMLAKNTKVPNKQMDGMVEAGGGKVFIGEYGITVTDPLEREANRKIGDKALKEIMIAIKERISGDY